MNCHDFRIQFLENAESKFDSPLPDELHLHQKSCAACQGFCQDIHAQYAALHNEKNTPSNPFLAQKIIYSMQEKKNKLDVAIPAFTKFVLYPVVVCLGLFAGYALNYVTVDEADAGDELAAETTAQVAADDAGSENDVLILNE